MGLRRRRNGAAFVGKEKGVCLRLVSSIARDTTCSEEPRQSADAQGSEHRLASTGYQFDSQDPKISQNEFESVAERPCPSAAAYLPETLLSTESVSALQFY